MLSFRFSVNNFDQAGMHLAQSLPSWIGLVMAAASIAGQPLMMVAVGLTMVLTSLKLENESALRASVSSLILLGLSPALKLVLRRARPDTAEALGLHNYSFPSGHSYGTMLIFGLLIVMAIKFLPAPWKWVVVVASAVFILLVGVSRVYLGAHYPSDVLGGWTLGLVVLGIVCKVTGLL